MINEAYQAVQAILNKEQLGYLKPMSYNAFVNIAVRNIYNESFDRHKTEVRKKNWMLDGRNFANISEYKKQLIEYFSTEAILTYPDYTIPSDLEFLQDAFTSKHKRIDKVDYSDYLDLQRNIYAKPTDCTPIFSKIGNKLKVSLLTIPDKDVRLHYIRKPKTAKWTYFEELGVAMFNQTAPDFQDIDLPETFYDKIVELVAEMGGIALRDANVIQAINQNQAEDYQRENKD